MTVLHATPENSGASRVQRDTFGVAPAIGRVARPRFQTWTGNQTCASEPSQPPPHRPRRLQPPMRVLSVSQAYSGARRGQKDFFGDARNTQTVARRARMTRTVCRICRNSKPEMKKSASGALFFGAFLPQQRGESLYFWNGPVAIGSPFFAHCGGLVMPIVSRLPPLMTHEYSFLFDAIRLT